MAVLWRAILLFAGVALVLMALTNAVATRRFLAHAERGDGVVARLNAGGSHPQVAFHVADGSEVTYPQGGLIAGYKVGQKVRVAYDPADPRGTARLLSFGSLWGETLILALCGLVLLGLAVVSFRYPTLVYSR